MTKKESFTPALGKFGMARLYDPIIKLSGEKKWRGLVLSHLAPEDNEVIVDVGCGTGSLALLLARYEREATIIAVDPDPEILSIARQKMKKSGLGNIEWRQGMGNKLADIVGSNAVNKITSSLVLHQCPMPMKRAILASMYEVLMPGGKLVIADFGLQRSLLMRLAFRAVQLADGKEDTQPNADGVIPALIRDAGFIDVREAEVINTPGGSISIYVASRADG